MGPLFFTRLDLAFEGDPFLRRTDAVLLIVEDLASILRCPFSLYDIEGKVDSRRILAACNQVLDFRKRKRAGNMVTRWNPTALCSIRVIPELKSYNSPHPDSLWVKNFIVHVPLSRSYR